MIKLAMQLAATRQINWWPVAISIKACTLAALSQFAVAQSALKDQALEFSSSVEEYAYSVSQDDWLEHEASLELLPVTIRLQRYQDLAFKYLVDMKSDDYERLLGKYSEELERYGNNNHKVTQEILEAFSLRAEFGDYPATIARLNDLLNSDTLSEAQRERATAALAYALTDAGMPEAAEDVIADRRAEANPRNTSPMAEIERADAAAYAHIQSGDYSSAILALRMSARRQSDIEMPFDSASMMASTAWLLRESGESQAAQAVTQTLGAARERVERQQAQSAGKDRSRSMADATPDSGRAGAPPPLSQLSDAGDGENEDFEGRADDFESQEDDLEENETPLVIPWRLLAWFAGGGLGLVLLVFVSRQIAARKPPRHRKRKPVQRRKIEPEPTVEDALEEEPEEAAEKAPEIPDVPIRLRTIEDATEGLLTELKVLIVDDNETNIDVLTGFLELYGLNKYYIARNGEEAWGTALRAPVDLIFMDIQMPILNGIEATKHIRAHRKGRSIPIVGVTAFSRVVNEEMCYEAGMSDFLTKPVELDKLYASLKKVLRGGAIL